MTLKVREIRLIISQLSMLKSFYERHSKEESDSFLRGEYAIQAEVVEELIQRLDNEEI